MEENKEMLELLKQIEQNGRQQARMGKLICLFCLIMALCSVAVFVLALNILPQVEAFLPQVGRVIDQMQAVLGNLEQTTQALASMDLGGMAADLDALVVSGRQSLEVTMEKLNTIDFEALNSAIEDLASVVEPLSRFASMFK